MRRSLVVAGIAATAIALLAAAASVGDARAGSGLTAGDIRFKNRPEAVRIVLRTTGAPLQEAQVFLTSRVRKLVRGIARIRIEVPGATALIATASGSGVTVGLNPKAQALIFRATSSPRRFKYVSYRVRQNPQRLAVDLWKSAPPSPGATARFGRGGCLTIDIDSSQSGRLEVSGSVGQLFEATFVVRIRRADGRVIKRRIVTMQPGAWQESIGYRVSSAQGGTVEAVAESAKDGSLDCLAQRHVMLQP